MPDRLTIIDNETRDELASMGMSVVHRRVLCRDCRFVDIEYKHTLAADRCLVNGLRFCCISNPHGECERYEHKPIAITRAPTGWIAQKVGPLGGLLVFTIVAVACMAAAAVVF